jgi:hypothetical protein
MNSDLVIILAFVVGIVVLFIYSIILAIKGGPLKLACNVGIATITAYLAYYFDLMHGFFGLGDQRAFMPDGLVLIIAFTLFGNLLEKWSGGIHKAIDHIWPDHKDGNDNQPPATGTQSERAKLVEYAGQLDRFIAEPSKNVTADFMNSVFAERAKVAKQLEELGVCHANQHPNP